MASSALVPPGVAPAGVFATFRQEEFSPECYTAPSLGAVLPFSPPLTLIQTDPDASILARLPQIRSDCAVAVTFIVSGSDR